MVLVRVLGPIEVRRGPDDNWVQPPPQRRLVLAMLVVQLGHPCRADRLAEALWGDRPPARARRLLQAAVSRLRRALEPPEAPRSRLRSVPDGWVLDVDAGEVDAGRFEQLARSGHALAEEGELDAARRRLETAASLRRGRPFAELADHPALVTETTRLDAEQVAVDERLLALRLRSGEHVEVVPELEAFISRHPLRERAWELLLAALYRSGRQADALAAYQHVRRRLVDELGTEPGPQLQRLHEAILRHELPLPAAGTVEPGANRPSQRADGAAACWPCRRDLPLVGRDRELATLERALAAVGQGRRQVVCVAGEAGVGKTRLAAELADRAGDARVAVLAGRCTEGAEVPYEPFVEALRADAAAAADGQLAGRLGEHAGELVPLLPELVERTGLRPSSPSGSPALDQYRLFDAVAGWLATAASREPVAVVLEDLHLATRPTLLLLRHVVRTTADSPLLLVATYRDTADELSADLVDALADVVRQPGVTQLALEGLDRPAVVALLAAQGHRPGMDAVWADAMHAATAGNPLFLEELLAAWDADPPTDPDRLRRRPPASQGIRHLLDTRLRRLNGTAMRLLQQAAVAGGRFELADVAAAAGLHEQEALDALEEATAAGLVAPAGAGADHHQFVHAVMRSALLDSTTSSRRARLHARLAAALETRHADDHRPVVSRLAHHYTAAGPAGDRTKRLRYTVAAGDAAMEQCAFDEAAACYDRAVQLLDAGDTEQRCELLLRLGQARVGAGHPGHRSALLQAARLAIDLADPDRVARAAFAGSRGFFSQIGSVDAERVALLHDGLELAGADHPAPRALLLALLGNELLFTADLARRRRLTEEAVRLARQHADAAVLGRVLALRQLTIQHPATLHERLRETAELIDLARRLDDPLVETLAHSWRFLAVLATADRPRAEAAIDEACRLADGLGHPMVRAFVHTLDVRELLWGSLDRAQENAQRFRTLADR